MYPAGNLFIPATHGRLEAIYRPKSNHDARVALDYLLDSQPNAREVIVAGFSFGSIVGLRVGCSDERVDRLIAIGAPARLENLDFIAGCAKPKLFIHGTEDDVAPLAPLEEFLATLPAGADFKLERIAGAGHFFDNHAGELMLAVKNFVGGATAVRER